MEINGSLFACIPKSEARRFNWRKGTEVSIGRIDMIQKKLVIEEMPKEKESVKN